MNKIKEDNASKNFSLGTNEDDQPIIKRQVVCGIALKRDARPIALVPLMGLYFTNIAAGVFTSAWVVFLLRDENLSNVPKE